VVSRHTTAYKTEPSLASSLIKSFLLEIMTERVRFIGLCQGIGFTLREIEKLLALHQSVAEYIAVCRSTARQMKHSSIGNVQ
jgi:hypothetical protein